MIMIIITTIMNSSIYTTDNSIKEPTCWGMISLISREREKKQKYIHTELTLHIPTFLQPGKRSSHMNRGGFAEELVFTSCRTATEGESRERQREERRAGTVTHPEPQVWLG